MSIICPTVLASNQKSYRQQMERAAKLAHRLQIDLMDGVFTSAKSIPINQVWWPVGVKADIHLMYKAPLDFVDELIKLRPHMVIIHAEAEGNFVDLQTKLKGAGVKVGIALLKDTAVSEIQSVLASLDHVLIFSGDLGKFGGRADLSLLNKVKDVKKLRPDLEVGWDGGVNQYNAKELAAGGVDVLNVGGYIQRSEHPEEAYATLGVQIIETNK